MRLWFLMAWMVVVAGQAFARIGENQIQHEQRYGRAREDAGTNTSATLQLNCTKTYEYEGWRLWATFERGRAECVEYWRSFPNDDEVMAVLRAESGDGRWTKASHERWTNTNGRVAVRGMYNVRVTTAGFAARKAAEEAERRKPKPPPAF